MGKTLIIGAGEVGQALKEVLSPFHETYLRDIKPFECKAVKVLHICYPDHPGFIETTKRYIKDYDYPEVTIINSSVSVGTTRKFDDNVVYSPVRGRHPDNGLANEMRIFRKFVAGLDPIVTNLAVHHFRVAGLRIYSTDNPDALEYLKLMSNVHMGLEIAWRQEVGRMMKSFHIEDKDYEAWEETYSEGYQKLGQYHLMRPLMRPDPIGGHCILPCTEILKSQYPSKALDFIQESNQLALRESA